jgi:hypothetical protein
MRLDRRSFCAAAAALLATDPLAARKSFLPGGHRRSGANREIRGTLVAGMPAIPVMLGAAGPFLFEIATVGRGFSIRSELARKMGAGIRGDGTADLPPAFAADLALARPAPAKLFDPGWPLPEPLAGVIGLDVFGDLSLSLDLASGAVGVGPVSLPEPDGKTIFPYRTHDAPVVPVSVAGTTFPARISTGQIRAPLLLRPALARALAAGPAEGAGEAFADGRRFELQRIVLKGPARVGTTPLPASSAVFPGPSEENSLGALGLAGLVLQLDRLNRRVRIAPGA